jgi:hypothetical protein
MSHSRQFIEQLAIGDSSAAKDTLENIISNKAFEALDIYKKEMASSIFGGVNEAKEMEDNEETVDEEFDQLDELSKGTLQSYRNKASDQEDKLNDRSDKLAAAVDRAKINPNAKPRSDATIRQKYGKASAMSDKADKRQRGEYRAFEKMRNEETLDEEVNKTLSQHFSKHFGHVYDDEQSQAKKVYNTVSKKYGEHVASDMVKHSNHAYEASIRRGKASSDAAKSATKIRNKHNINHEEFD